MDSEALKNNKLRSTTRLFALSTAWAFAVFALYALFHLPGGYSLSLFAPGGKYIFNTSSYIHIADEMLTLLYTLWFVSCAIIFGYFLLFFFRIRIDSLQVKILFASGLGLGSFSLVTFFLAENGWVATNLIRAALLVISAAGVGALIYKRKDISCLLSKYRTSLMVSAPFDWEIRTFIIGTFVCVILQSLLPPTAWDALMYHLIEPAHIAASGHIYLSLYNPHLYYPQLIEMLYTDGFLLHGQQMAAPIHVSLGILASCTLFALASNLYGKIVGQRSVALFLAMPSVVLVMSWQYIDMGVVFYVLLAFLALVLWQQMKPDSYVLLVLSGVFAGLAADAKYTGLLYIAFLGLTIAALQVIRQRNLWLALKSALLFYIVALLCASPWLVRNNLLTGNPLYPFHDLAMFPYGPGWDAVRENWMQGAGFGLSLTQALLLPIRVFLYGTQGGDFDATLGPLLLILFPLGLGIWFLERKRVPGLLKSFGSEAHFLIPIFAIFVFIYWEIEVTKYQIQLQSRPYFPIFALLTVLGGLIWARLEEIFVFLRTKGLLFSFMLILFCCISLAGQFFSLISDGNAAYLLGMESQDDYFQTHLSPYYDAVTYLNQHEQPQDSTLYLWETRSYYQTGSVEPDPFLDNFAVLYRENGSVANILQTLHSRGVKYILFYNYGFHLATEAHGAQDTPDELATFQHLLSSPTLHMVYQDSIPFTSSNGQKYTGWYKVFELS